MVSESKGGGRKEKKQTEKDMQVWKANKLIISPTLGIGASISKVLVEFDS